jgi:hypothetical protein
MSRRFSPLRWATKVIGSMFVAVVLLPAAPALAVKPTNSCDPLHKDGVARQPSTGIIWICK